MVKAAVIGKKKKMSKIILCLTVFTDASRHVKNVAWDKIKSEYESESHCYAYGSVPRVSYSKLMVYLRGYLSFGSGRG